jgi:hypothetical protein
VSRAAPTHPTSEIARESQQLHAFNSALKKCFPTEIKGIFRHNIPLVFPFGSARMRRLFFGKVAEKAAQYKPSLKSSSTYLSIGKLKMKRSALIAALLALSLSACGEKPAETAAPVAAPATEAVTPAAAPATEAAAPASEAPQSAAK